MTGELKLSQIWIYPVKSLGGIRVRSAKVLPKGLQFDRRWMLVDEHGIFMTQRVYPKMALFKLSLNYNDIIISFRPNKDAIGYNAIKLDVNTPPLGSVIRTRVWDDEVDTIEVDPQISEWFSEKLSMKCRLVLFPEQHTRPVDRVYQLNNDHVSLADAFPFLIIGQSSLDDLNTRLDDKVEINRFRPNFVFMGGKPYEEDDWKDFSIGLCHFRAMKPCARCVLITVDQDTAEKGSEPLATLSRYRKRDNKVYFGQNVLSISTGVVSEGDAVVLNQ